MENRNVVLVAVILGIALLAMLPYGMGWGLCGMMGNWNYGSGGYGLGRMISWTTNIAVLVLIIVGIVWLINNMPSRTRK